MECYYKRVSKEELKEIVETAKSLAEVMRRLGYTANRGNSFKGLKSYLNECEIDYSRFTKDNPDNFSHPVNELKDILVKDGEYTNMTRLKKRVIAANLLPHKCSICGISEWNGRELVLQLDHINGDNRDNRIENLRLLCPNCHSQTETFCKRKKVDGNIWSL